MAENIFSTLEEIIYKSDVEFFKSSVDTLDDINIQHEKYGWTLLHMTIRRNEREMIEYLLDKGADINKVDGVGWTPLMEAIMDNYADLCKLLVDAGADKTLQNKRGVTAPMLAQKFGRENMYDFLN